MTKNKSVCAIVLAGGKSSRMGTDKGLMDFSGKPMIEHVLKTAAAVTSTLLIVSNNPAYKKYGYPVVGDKHKNCGPLGGIHSGLTHSSCDWNLVLGCDMPFISAEFLTFLLTKISAADAVVPVHHGLAEPLCALYNRSSLPSIESLLLEEEYKMQTVVKALNTLFTPVPEEIFDADVLFKNINSPADIVTPR